jgi:uncharacterized protein (DUF1501 family)
MVTRRDALKTLFLGSAAAVAGWPRLCLARVPGEGRLVFVFLRGGLDGLAAVAPYGEPAYARVRGELSVAAATGDALKLDGMFALHPQLTHVHAMFLSGECAVLHAVATAYRSRSHFDAQNLLENGTARPHARDAGWLNLALQSVKAGDQPSLSGIALANTAPLVIRGPAPVATWSPSLLPAPDADLLERLVEMYRDDRRLRTALDSALQAQAMLEAPAGESRTAGGAQAFAVVARAAGNFLAQTGGPRIATIDMGGWDTHANQSSELGPLTRNLRMLDRGLDTLKAALGSAWKHTAVVVVTEFGRTVPMNGSRGTDHGTGAAAFVLGGSVRGGRVIADWPGLNQSALYEGRDLKPTADLRSLFKAVLTAQLGVTEAALETSIFPDSVAVKPIEGLFA